MSKRHPEVRLNRAPFSEEWQTVRVSENGIITDVWPLHADDAKRLDALEAAEQKLATSQRVNTDLHRVAAEAQAVIAEALAQRLDHGAQGNGYAQLVDRICAILSQSSTGALQAVKAAAWDEGHAGDLHGSGLCECINPYRKDKTDD